MKIDNTFLKRVLDINEGCKFLEKEINNKDSEILYLRHEKGTLVVQNKSLVFKFVRPECDPPTNFLSIASEKQGLLMTLFEKLSTPTKHSFAKLPFHVPYHFLLKMTKETCQVFADKIKNDLIRQFIKSAKFVNVLCMDFFESSLQLYMNSCKFNEDTETQCIGYILVVILSMLSLYNCIHFVHGDLHINNILLRRLKTKNKKLFLNFKIEDFCFKIPVEHEIALSDLEYAYYKNDTLTLYYDETRRLLKGQDRVKSDIILFFYSIRKNLIYQYEHYHDTFCNIIRLCEQILGGSDNIVDYKEVLDKNIKKYSVANYVHDVNLVFSIDKIIKLSYFHSFRVPSLSISNKLNFFIDIANQELRPV